MAAATRAGRYVSRPPLGFKMESKHGVKNIVPDAQAPLIREAFEMMSTGNYSLDAVLRRVNALGLLSRGGKRMTKQSLSFLLHNRLFCGWLVTKSGDIKDKDNFPAIVDEETWERANAVMTGRRASSPKSAGNPDFPLRGTVLCAGCNRPLTAGWAKGRNGRFPLYWCWTKGCKTAKDVKGKPRALVVSRDKLGQHFIGMLGMLDDSKAILDALPKLAEGTREQRQKTYTDKKRELSTRKSEIDTLNRRAIDAFISGKLGEEDFQTAKQDYSARLAAIEEEIKALESRHSDTEEPWFCPCDMTCKD